MGRRPPTLAELHKKRIQDARPAVFRRRGVLNWLEVVTVVLGLLSLAFFRAEVAGQSKGFGATRGVFSSTIIVSINFIDVI